MSNTIKSIARQIATKLDSIDKDGKNGRIDKDTWNPFSAGKGNQIQRYINVDAASASIAYYLNREAQKSDGDKIDIGQKWLNGIDIGPMKEITLNEVIIKGNKRKIKPLFSQPSNEILQANLNIKPITIPAATKTDAGNAAPTPIIQDDTPDVKTNDQNAHDLEPQLVDNELYENDSDNDKFFNSFNNQVKIHTALKEIRFRYGRISGINDIISRIASEVSKIDSENLSNASIIKTIKENCLTDIQKAFHYNNKVYRFIYAAATTISNTFDNDSKLGTRDDIITTAQDYVDANIKTQAEGNVYFSGNHRRAWCADTVSTIIKESLGEQLPESFGSASVSSLRSWGNKHNCYTETSRMNSSGRKNFIANNVKVGDIMIEKRNRKSHTGIVIEVAEDGSWFRTIEGNSSKSVTSRTYSSDSKTLSGFVSMEQFVTDDKQKTQTAENLDLNV